MPGDPKECREHALHCLELAKTASSPQVKAKFLGLADTWTKLADDAYIADDRIARSPSEAPPPEGALSSCGSPMACRARKMDRPDAISTR